MSTRRRGPMLVGGAVVVVLSLLLWNERTAPVRVPPPAPDPVPVRVPAPPPPPAPAAPAPVPEAFTEDHAVQLAGPNGVVCATDPVVDGARARLEVDATADFLGVAVLGGGFLVLSDVPPSGEAILHVEGFAPVALRWSDALDGPAQGGCDPSPVPLEPSATAVVGTVANAAGREVTVEVCGRPVVLEPDGSFYADAAAGETCDVFVRRHFGVVQFEDHHRLTPQLGRDAVVRAEVPDLDAVLPFVLEAVDGGLRITADWTHDDLQGAVVVSADGEPAGPDALAFHMAVGGAAGEVIDVVLADGRTVPVELRALGFDDWLVEN